MCVRAVQMQSSEGARPHLHLMQLRVPRSHLQHTPKSVLRGQFQAPASPCRRKELERVPARFTQQEGKTMRYIASIVLPIVLAAGISGMMFTATLA